MKDRTFLVTGAAGFLGHHLFGQLLDVGHRVVALVRDHGAIVQPFTTTPNAVLVRGCVEDQSLLERVLAEYEVDTTIHLAAQTQVSVALADPAGTWRTNAGGTASFLEACRRQKTRRIIVASTDKVYGDAESADENAPLRGRSPYEASKAAGDILAQTYAASYGMNITVTRCGNLYGPGQLNWSTLVAGTIRRVLAGEPPVLRAQGKMLRDFVYVDDAVRAYLMLSDLNFVGPINLASGRPVEIGLVVQTIVELVGATVVPIFEDAQPGEILLQRIDVQRARRLGWAPAWNLRDGLAKTVEWYREYLR